MNRPALAPRPNPRVPSTARREELLSALDWILASTPLLEVTIKQVTRVAGGCPSGTFYRHFDGLPALAAALVEAKSAEAAAAGQAAIAEPHIAAIARLFAVERHLPTAA